MVPSTWIGPALLAAFVAALISVVGWFVTAGQALRAERRRRHEKTRDFQIALRAEIRSELADLQGYDVESGLSEITRLYEADPTYVVRVSQPPRHMIFEAIVDEIHVLPEEVIDPVVLYVRQRQVLDGIAADIRDPTFTALSAGRQLESARNYAHARHRLANLADAAVTALGQLPK